MSNLNKTTLSFSLQNLGRVEDGEIEIKPLTLLCGENNTGKTWVMYSIYGFLKNNIEHLDGIDNIIEDLKKLGTLEFDMRIWLTTNFSKIIQTINDDNQRQLASIFNTNNDLFKATKFNWLVDLATLLEANINREFQFNLLSRTNGIANFVATKQTGSHIISMTLLQDIPEQILKNTISSLLYDNFKSIKHLFLIPAERNGLHLFYRELSSRRTALLHHASRTELDLHLLLKDVLGSRYAKPIADYIDWLNELTNIKKRAQPTQYHDLAEEVKKLINGKYNIDTEGNISFIPRKKRGGQTPPQMDLHLSSSTVKSLFGLWFYLEYQAQKHSMIMIDEPELNLHPSNQRAIAKLIAKMINQGLNVIVSTHSDYLVRELNSLIMLGDHHGSTNIKNTLIKKYEIDPRALLTKEQVGAYIVDNGQLKAMDIGDEGIIADTFDQQINLLNDSSDEIYYSYVQNENDE